MNNIEVGSFDGSQIDSSLTKSCDVKYRRTSLSLVALRQGSFVVSTGIDKEEEPFSDSDVSEIFATFGHVVDSNPADAPQELQKKIHAALASLWTLSPADPKCPFNLKVKYATRLVFHLHVPGWAFEDARIKFKTQFEPCEFSDLVWLTLNGQSQEPKSFSVTDKDSEKKVYEFALYIQANQTGTTGSTRIIIDPQTDNDGVGP